MARLDRLQPLAKETVQAASVIGRELSRDMLARACQRTRAEVDAALDDLMAARLIVKSGMSTDALTFRHALIQDAAYESLLRSKRQRYHKIIAQMLVETKHFEKAIEIAGLLPEVNERERAVHRMGSSSGTAAPLRQAMPARWWQLRKSPSGEDRRSHRHRNHGDRHRRVVDVGSLRLAEVGHQQ
jgi:hypothetical protein